MGDSHSRSQSARGEIREHCRPREEIGCRWSSACPLAEPAFGFPEPRTEATRRAAVFREACLTFDELVLWDGGRVTLRQRAEGHSGGTRSGLANCPEGVGARFAPDLGMATKPIFRQERHCLETNSSNSGRRVSGARVETSAVGKWAAAQTRTVSTVTELVAPPESDARVHGAETGRNGEWAPFLLRSGGGKDRGFPGGLALEKVPHDTGHEVDDGDFSLGSEPACAGTRDAYGCAGARRVLRSGRLPEHDEPRVLVTPIPGKRQNAEGPIEGINHFMNRARLQTEWQRVRFSRR